MSSPRKTVVPAIPSIGRSPNEIDAVLKAAKEALEVGYGRRGDPLDRFVTVRDLGDAGLAKPLLGRGTVTLAKPDAPPGTGAPIFDPDAPDFGEDDYTVPLTPVNVQARGVGPDSIMVTWDPPGYHNHDRAEVFCVPQAAVGVVPTFSLAAPGFAPNKPVAAGNQHPQFAGSAAGTIFTHAGLTRFQLPGQDALGAALEPPLRYYFVRFVSTAGVPGPYAPLNGAPGRMTVDQGAVLGAMITNIQNSAIYENLLHEFFDTTAIDPILTAGGIQPYINQQDGIRDNKISDVTAIIGASTPAQAGPVTLIQRISTLQGQAAADHAALNDLQTWQAALSMTSANLPAGAPFTIVAYASSAGQPATLTLATAPSLSVGDDVLITTPGTSPILAASGKLFKVTAVNAVQRTVTLQRDASSTAFLPTIAVAGLTDTTVRKTRPSQGVVDFIGSVFRNLYVSADPGTVLARELQSVNARIGTMDDGFSLFAETQRLEQARVAIDGKLDNLWSVRMRQQNDSGLVFTAGFGLSLESGPDPFTGSYESLSTFLINANQFAVMGPSMSAGAVVTAFAADNQFANVTLKTANHGFVPSGDPEKPNIAVFSIPDTSLRIGEGDDAVVVANPLAPYAGLECAVVQVSGAVVRVRRMDNGSFFGAFADLGKFNGALLPGANIPFIIDTARQTVGIRGRLVVDGLIRATRGDFDALTSNTAFITQLQSEIVNANTVIAQRLIAGTPDVIDPRTGKNKVGAISASEYAGISNYIVELSNPVNSLTAAPTGQAAVMQFWKPATGEVNFYLDKLGNMGVGGNLSVGNNATIATSGANLCSIGGAGADGNYAMWIGPRDFYGSNGGGRTEDRGLFWIKDNGRAGFNADLFLGENALSLPTMAATNQEGSGTFEDGSNGIRATTLVTAATSSTTLQVRALRSGSPASVFVTVSGNLIRTSPSSNNGDTKRFKLKVQLVGAPGATTGHLLQEVEMDDWKPETWAYSLSGVLALPAGSYYVRLDVTNLNVPSGAMSIIKGWNAVAMQVTASGGLQ